MPDPQLPVADLEAVFDRFAAAHRVPDLAWGVVSGGRLVHSGGAAPDRVHRIASMTKSFTAASVLGLRDAGRLRLDDPAVAYVPELEGLRYPSADSPAVTIADLLSMRSGLVTDDPWADRLLDLDDDAFARLLTAGVGFDRVPGTTFVYSNLGYAILGRVVASVTGAPLRHWVDEHLLGPLGMTATTWDVDRLGDRAATGHRLQGDELVAEAPLGDGAFGAMAGLASTVEDLARWVAWHLDAWPARDDPDEGPLRRASRREMATARTLVRNGDGTPAGYGLGLLTWGVPGVGDVVGHSGGLPGFGSHMAWVPDAGWGVVALANRTYAPAHEAVRQALTVLAGSGSLAPRPVVPSEALLAAQSELGSLYERWDDDLAARTLLPTYLLDLDEGHRPADLRALRERWGQLLSTGPLTATGDGGGSWRWTCAEGILDATVILGPTLPPRVMWLTVEDAAAGHPTLRQTVLDAVDHRGLAEFYRQLLGWAYRPGDEPGGASDGDDWYVLVGPGDRRLAFQQVEHLPAATWPDGPLPQQVHLDLTVEDVEALAAQRSRAMGLGATALADRSDDADEPLHVLADPAGHPFCIFVAAGS